MSRAVAVAHLYGHPLHIGGVETHLLSLMAHTDSASFRFVLLAPASPLFSEKAERLGAEILTWRPTHALDLRALPSLLAHLHDHGIDLVHLHSPRVLALGRWAARARGLPAVMTVHLPAHLVAGRRGWVAGLKRSAYLWGERLLGRRFPDRVIHVSRRAMERARALGLAPSDRTVLIENGVEAGPEPDSERGSRVREAMGVDAKVPVGICVARLDEQKGLDLLLEALALLGPAGSQAQFWIVGDGPLRASLEKRADLLGLRGRARFLGFRTDVPALLGASDFFVLPSRAEALSFALLEALAAGLPCIVADAGDGGPLVTEGTTGSVVPCDDPVALAAALRNMLADPSRWEPMGKEARKTASAFTARRMAESVQAVYRALVPCPR